MKVSLNWARQFTEIDLPTDELVKLATERLGGIEGYEDLGKHYEGIVVAKIVSCIKHPNADKLQLCKVDDGGVTKNVERDENGHVQVVCGAPNAREGLLVGWIPPASIVPASYGEKELFVLEARDLRGELSNGMLASPRELGMNDDHDGILELDDSVQPGTPFKNLYDLDDVVLEIENKMFTHRPDCFGQLGVARELAGIQHKTFNSPEWYLNPVLPKPASTDFSVVLENQIPELCPRYMAVVLDNVVIKPSPLWLQTYLKRVGIRPINNVVDITNYMMVLTAQPLHAFDFDKVAKDGSAKIVVRKPAAGEKMTLLDGKTIEPHKEAVLICNDNTPIALGGVMGGGNSEIDEKTTKVVLECATFDMYNIRKTSMIHGIFTDAVTRFNKGQPAGQLPSVLAKAVEMFAELAESSVASEIVDNNKNAPKNDDNYVEVTSAFINDRLGSKFTDQQIVDLLNNVELKTHVASGPLNVTPPFWRTDIEIKEDLVEEVGRLYGFNQLPMDLPVRDITPVQPDAKLALKRKIREILARAGANEVLTYSFVHGNLLNKTGQDPKNSYAIRNALSPDLQYYRQTLTPSLLDLVHSNVRAGYDQFALFELNKTHNKVHGNGEDELPGELHFVALTYANNNKSAGPAYYEARKYLEYLAGSLGFTLSFAPISEDLGYPVTAPFEYTRSALVTINEGKIFLGIVGEYRAEVVKNLKLPTGSAGFEVGLEALLEAVDTQTNSSYKPLSKYPSSEQDITLRVADGVLFAQLEACVAEQLEKSDYDYTLTTKSIYQKEGDTAKNITFGITLTHHEHTLTSSEVSKQIQDIVVSTKDKLGAEQI